MATLSGVADQGEIKAGEI